MLNYLPFHLKYRPKSLSDVVGQEVITHILQREIQLSQIPNSMIFAGHRGCGKTSIARIIARALNCLNPINGNPCNVCINCISILKENFPDVIEMDAGSLSGVDNARALAEDCMFGAKFGKYKVYIIDESHNLTKKAWDALLKTIEEPLSTIKFIFCTTALEKIPQTIISRSQIFLFEKINIKDIFKALSNVVKKENLDLSEDILLEIAEKSDGSMRDALVMLEQVFLVKNDEILLTKILNRVTDSQIILFIEYLLSSSYKESFLFIKELQISETFFLDKLSKFLCDLLTEESEIKNKIKFENIILMLEIINEWKISLTRTLSRTVTNEFYIVKLINSLSKSYLSKKEDNNMESSVEKIAKIMGGSFEKLSEDSYVVINKKGVRLYVVTKKKIPPIGYYCVYPDDTTIFINSGKNPNELLKEKVIKKNE